MAANPRHDLYLEIDQNLVVQELTDLRNYVSGTILSARFVQHADANQIFKQLEKEQQLKPGDLSLLAHLMRKIRRNDYVEKAEKIAEDERKELRKPQPSTSKSPGDKSKKRPRTEFDSEEGESHVEELREPQPSTSKPKRRKQHPPVVTSEERPGTEPDFGDGESSSEESPLRDTEIPHYETDDPDEEASVREIVNRVSLLEMSKDLFLPNVVTNPDKFKKATGLFERHVKARLGGGELGSETEEPQKLKREVKLRLKKASDQHEDDVHANAFVASVLGDLETYERIIGCFEEYKAILKRITRGCLLCHLEFDDASCYRTFLAAYRDGRLSETLTRELITDDMMAAEGEDLYVHVTLLGEDGECQDGTLSDKELQTSLKKYYELKLSHFKPLIWNDNFTLTLSDIFTQLELVPTHGKHVSGPKEYLRSGERKEIKSLDGLFNPDVTGRSTAPRCILIDGEPGVGKTTFLSKEALDAVSQKTELGRRHDLVLLLRLREVRERETIEEMVWDQCVPKTIEGVDAHSIKAMLQRNESRVLFLLDGYDELRSEARTTGQAIPKLLSGKLYPDSTIVITSRPSAGVQQHTMPDYHVNIMDFSHSHVEKYVRQYFRQVEKPELADKLLTVLSERPLLTDLIHTPFSLMIVCILFEEDPEMVSTGAISVLCENYLTCLVRKYCRREWVDMPTEGLPTEVAESLLQLGKFALEALIKNETLANLAQVERENVNLELLLKLGVVSLEASSSNLDPMNHLHFPHKTMQEFLAGRYVAHALMSQDIAELLPLTSVTKTIELSNLLLFTCGCDSRAAQAVMAELSKLSNKEFPSSTNEVKRKEDQFEQNTTETSKNQPRTESDAEDRELHLKGLHLTDIDMPHYDTNDPAAEASVRESNIRCTLSEMRKKLFHPGDETDPEKVADALNVYRGHRWETLETGSELEGQRLERQVKLRHVTLLGADGECQEDTLSDEDVFQKSVKKYYELKMSRVKPLIWNDDFTLSFDDIFTQLELIPTHKKQVNGPNEYLRSGERKEVKSLDDLFNPDVTGQSIAPRCVLIEGEPGVGKTTFLSKQALDAVSQKTELGRRHDIVLLIRLREVRERETIEEMVWDQCVPETIEGVDVKSIRAILQRNGSRVLFLLDGYDELRPEARVAGQAIPELLSGKVYPNSTIVITSRPSAGVQQYVRPDGHVHIIGFSHSHVEKYVRQYFRQVEKPELAEKLLSVLSGRPLLTDLIHTPTSLMFICILFEEDPEMISTGAISGLYANYLTFLVRKHCRREGAGMPTEGLPTEVAESLLQLGKLALEALLRYDTLVPLEIVEVEKGKLELLSKLGVVSLEVSASKLIPRKWLNFSHKTMQEFLAGRYVAHALLNQDIVDLLQLTSISKALELSNLLQFTCGCDSRAAQAVMGELSKLSNKEFPRLRREPYERSNVSMGKDTQKFKKTYEMFADLCLNILRERQEPEVLQVISQALPIVILDSSINSTGATVLKYYVQNLRSANLPERLILKIREASDNRDTVQYLQQCFTTSLPGLKLDLKLSGRFASPDETARLVSVLENVPDLRALQLPETGLTPVSLQPLVQGFSHMPLLEELNLSGNPELRDSGMDVLLIGLHVVPQLAVLRLRAVSMTAVGISSLASCKHYLAGLREVDVSGNMLGDKGIETLADMIKFATAIKVLNLGFTGISGKGILSLVKVLPHLSELQVLDVRLNNIGDSEIVTLVQALCQPSSLDTEQDTAGDKSQSTATCYNNALRQLNIGWNTGVTGAGLGRVAQLISALPALIWLDMSGPWDTPAHLSDTSAMDLTKALPRLPALEKLDLRHISMEPAGFQAVVQAAEEHPGLKELFIIMDLQAEVQRLRADNAKDGQITGLTNRVGVLEGQVATLILRVNMLMNIHNNPGPNANGNQNNNANGNQNNNANGNQNNGNQNNGNQNNNANGNQNNGNQNNGNQNNNANGNQNNNANGNQNNGNQNNGNQNNNANGNQNNNANGNQNNNANGNQNNGNQNNGNQNNNANGNQNNNANGNQNNNANGNQNNNANGNQNNGNQNNGNQNNGNQNNGNQNNGNQNNANNNNNNIMNNNNNGNNIQLNMIQNNLAGPIRRQRRRAGHRNQNIPLRRSTRQVQPPKDFVPTMKLYCLSGHPNLPCLVLKFKSVTVMLDCALDLTTTFSFLPLPLVHSTRLAKRPSWVPKDADAGDQDTLKTLKKELKLHTKKPWDGIGREKITKIVQSNLLKTPHPNSNQGYVVTNGLNHSRCGGASHTITHSDFLAGRVYLLLIVPYYHLQCHRASKTIEVTPCDSDILAGRVYLLLIVLYYHLQCHRASKTIEVTPCDSDFLAGRVYLLLIVPYYHLQCHRASKTIEVTPCDSDFLAGRVYLLLIVPYDHLQCHRASKTIEVTPCDSDILTGRVYLLLIVPYYHLQCHRASKTIQLHLKKKKNDEACISAADCAVRTISNVIAHQRPSSFI
uniref:NACHT domain-containing protein n=1 Tax=Branchiostoma floridae TaxID=7739 RepID=C3ZPU9_BRAFL|eukprot:XP_002589317.1 hypothetical protein BRAFLDRAFT_77770 [Branchiostoma floridae]